MVMDGRPELPADRRERAIQAMRDAYEVAAHPIRSVSLYYTLYHLAEIDGREAFMFDWSQHRDRLRRGLLGYGAYAVARELRHLFTGFSFRDQPFRDYDWQTQQAAIDRRFTECRLSGDHDVDRLLEAFNFDDVTIDSAEPPLVVAEREATALERWGRVFSEPTQLAHGAACIFSWGTQETAETGWYRMYGGDAWASIARWLSQYGEQPTTVWVDTGLALAHNKRQFLDKLAYHDREYDVALAVTQVPEKPPPRDFVRDVTQDLLDRGRQGNVRAHAEFAMQYQSTDLLSGNLRRVVDDLPGDGWPVPPEYRERDGPNGGGV